MLISLIIAFILLFAGPGYIFYRRNAHQKMLNLTINLARGYFKEEDATRDLDHILQSFHRAMDALKDADKYVHSEKEREKVDHLKKDFLDWRDEEAARYYNNKFKKIYDKATKSKNQEEKLVYFIQAREMLLGGNGNEYIHLLPRLNQYIVQLQCARVEQKVRKIREKADKLEYYEQTLWEILHDGIPDAELEQMDDVQELIRKIDKLEKEPRKTRKKSPNSNTATK